MSELELYNRTHDGTLFTSSDTVTSVEENDFTSDVTMIEGYEVLRNSSSKLIDEYAVANFKGKRPLIYSISQDIMLYCLLILVPCGLLCNTLSVRVFLNKRMRKRASSWYLAALAISDDIVLMTAFFEYCLKNPKIGLDIVKHSHFLCVFITHLSYASRLMSALLVTTFTAERFIGVIYPLQRAGFSCTLYVRKVIAVEAAVSIFCTSFIVFTIGVVDLPYGRECDVIPSEATVYFVFNIIVLIFGSILIPIVVICTLNIYIMHKVYRKRKHFIERKVSFGTDQTMRYRRRSDYNVATLLLVVSMSFVVLNLPYCTTWFLLFVHHYKLLHITGQSAQWSLFAVKYLTSVVYYLNYAINFVLYNLCARIFRTELIRVLLCCNQKQIQKRSPLSGQAQ